ncbi:MAG TPA: hypothetical protein DDW52_15215 [Planctomycetaceae bacterium]|nr:hypothetical protein [Planctomycetaceae bacterium]
MPALKRCSGNFRKGEACCASHPKRHASFIVIKWCATVLNSVPNANVQSGLLANQVAKVNIF